MAQGKEKKYPNYKPTADETKRMSMIDERFQKMVTSRSAVDRDRPLYQKMIEAIFEPYPDERSSSTVPLATAIIELFVAETLKLETDYTVKGETSESATAAKALDYAWKYDFRRNNRKKVFLRDEYVAAGFGTSVIYTGFEAYNKTQQDPVVNDMGEITWEEKSYKDDQIIVSNVDIRNFYIDDEVISDFEEANDCILRQWVSHTKFQCYADNPMYKNIKFVKPKAYSSDYKRFSTQEELIKQGEYVELKHYWNLEEDQYTVVANGVEVRNHPMISTIDGKKALPFVVRPLGYKIFSIWGKGFCEALLMFNSEINNLREMLMDGIRRSNSNVIAIGGGLSFNGRNFAFNNEVLTFDGNLDQNFKQISGTPPNQAIFSYLTQIYKDIAVYVGIDVQNLIGQPQQTAFQTEVQRESSQKRINTWFANRDMARERFANLYKDLLQTYFPRKDIDGQFPKIEIEGEKYNEATKKFMKRKGKSIFEVTPEVLRGEINIDVYTNINAPTINAVDKQMKMEFAQTVGGVVQGYALAQQAGFDLNGILPLKTIIGDLASDYNFTPQETADHQELQTDKADFVSKLQSMIPQNGAQPQQDPTAASQESAPAQTMPLAP